MRKFVILMSIAGLLSISLPPQSGAAAADDFVPQRRIPLPSKSEYNRMSESLGQEDAASIEASVGQIRSWIAGGRVAPDLYSKWLPELMSKKRYSDVESLALFGMLMRPEQRFVDRLSVFRVDALMAENRYAEAAQASKSFYNVCSMDRTPAAIDLVERTLAALHPEDKGVGMRFREEQVLAADDSGASANKTDPIVRSIVVESNLFAKAIEYWKAKAERGRSGDQLSYANVLLLADKPVEAEKQFKELSELAMSSEELNTAIDGTARSMRAEDGTVGRANTWLLSMCPTAAKGTDRLPANGDPESP